MNPEPRQRDDYSPRQIEAARRVLVDVGQVLASFSDCVVVVGGWVPDLLLTDAVRSRILGALTWTWHSMPRSSTRGGTPSC